MAVVIEAWLLWYRRGSGGKGVTELVSKSWNQD